MIEWFQHFIGWDTACVVVGLAIVYCVSVRIRNAIRRHAAKEDQEAGR